MKLNEVNYPNGQPIDGYGLGFFRIGGEPHDAPLLIVPDGVMSWGGFEDLEPLIQADNIDVLLIGTGDSITPLPVALVEAVEASGVGVEPMGSAQACRTYNVLLGEGRRVGVALLPITKA